MTAKEKKALRLAELAELRASGGTLSERQLLETIQREFSPELINLRSRQLGHYEIRGRALSRVELWELLEACIVYESIILNLK